MTFLELAERCERATGPDHELDMLIDCARKGIEAVYPAEGHPMTPGRGGRIEVKGTFELLGWIDPGEVSRNFSPYGGDARYPKVTASLDAAMALIGPDVFFHVSRFSDGGEGSAHVYPNRGLGDDYESDAATPALALCAAALKARGALAGEAATAAETTQIGSVHEHATAQPERPNPTPILPKKERTRQ